MSKISFTICMWEKLWFRISLRWKDCRERELSRKLAKATSSSTKALFLSPKFLAWVIIFFFSSFFFISVVRLNKLLLFTISSRLNQQLYYSIVPSIVDILKKNEIRKNPKVFAFCDQSQWILYSKNFRTNLVSRC